MASTDSSNRNHEGPTEADRQLIRDVLATSARLTALVTKAVDRRLWRQFGAGSMPALLNREGIRGAQSRLILLALGEAEYPPRNRNMPARSQR